MPISFPSSPSVNDIYTYNGAKYIWDGVKWVSGGQNAYIVQGEDATLGATQVSSLNGGPLAGFRNKLICADFRIWQRYSGNIPPPSGGGNVYGVLITSSSLFGCDRWSSRNPNNSGGTVAHLRTNGANGNGLRLDVSGSTGYQFIQQTIERSNIMHLSNREVTLSLECDRSTVRARVRTYDNTGTFTEVLASTVAPTNLGSNRYSWTFTLPIIGAGTTTLGNEENNDLGMQIILYPDGLNTLNGATLFKEVQLEPGPVATPFEHRPYGTEFALCQRYYQTQAVTGTCFNNAGVSSGAEGYINFPLNMPMRSVAPTLDRSHFCYSGTFSGVNLHLPITSSAYVNRGALRIAFATTGTTPNSIRTITGVSNGSDASRKDIIEISTEL